MNIFQRAIEKFNKLTSRFLRKQEQQSTLKETTLLTKKDDLGFFEKLQEQRDAILRWKFLRSSQCAPRGGPVLAGKRLERVTEACSPKHLTVVPRYMRTEFEGIYCLPDDPPNVIRNIKPYSAGGYSINVQA